MNLNIDITNAISSLFPGAKWAFHGEVTYENLTWLDEEVSKPSKATLEKEVVRLQAEYNAKQYQRDRAPEYPSLTDLADAMYWASKGDNTKLDNYYAACEAVKLKYPKS
jgi:uncharacterized small protein (DUF1192 family)